MKSLWDPPWERQKIWEILTGKEWRGNYEDITSDQNFSWKVVSETILEGTIRQKLQTIFLDLWEKASYSFEHTSSVQNPVLILLLKEKIGLLWTCINAN